MTRRQTKTFALIASTLAVILALASTLLNYAWQSSPPAGDSDDALVMQRSGPPPKKSRSSTVKMDMPPDEQAGNRGTPDTGAIAEQYFTDLLFLDDSGKPAPNVAFEVIFLSTIVNERAHRLQEMRYGVSDADGRARIVAKTNSFDGTIKVGDEDWVQTAPIEFSGSIYARPMIPSDGDGSEKLIVHVQWLLSVEFRFVYDDGMPFTGTATLSSPQMPAYNAGTHVDETARFTFRVPIVDLECRANPSRAGYVMIRRVIESDQLYAGAVIEIVVPPSTRPMGNASVNTSALTGGHVRWWYQLIVRDTGKVVSSANQTSVEVGDVRQWKNLLEGWYVLIAGCEGKVSRVEFEVTASVLSEAVLDQVYDPAEVSVVIQDEAGNILNGGVLRTAHRKYVDYPARDVPGSVAVSDSGGVAKLGFLHPDTTTLVVEANGYDAKSVAVSLSSGQSTDLGPVRLDVALGRIEVRVENMKEGETYKLGCLDPYGSGGKSNDTELSNTDTHIYERMPFRLYTVYVVPKGGGKVHSINIELTPDAPTATVVLDASKTSPKD